MTMLGTRAATAARAMAIRWSPQVASRARAQPVVTGGGSTTSPSGSSATATPSLPKPWVAKAASRSVSWPRVTATPRMRDRPMASAARAATVVTWSGMAARSASTGSRAAGPRTVRQAPWWVTLAPIASSSRGSAASGCRVPGSASVTVTVPAGGRRQGQQVGGCARANEQPLRLVPR